ncbi:MAG TPA: ADP-ribosylglycohydrolase family protein [Propionibacteriaceae bacterium]|jgi:ADP-ribosylglycohydrolase|nr:ADP-ribosylglycohydrolase family protein [Propionibacteriaceae bacterium]
MSTASDRARGALYGLAIGDALGMPTQLMSHEEVSDCFGVLDGFREAPADHPIAAGLPAGSITDDTEQALLLADALLIGGGHLDTEDLARRLVAWAERARERGSLDLLGPSSSAVVAAAVAGAPLDETRFGATNGAAMRITPVGLMMSTDDLDALVDLVVEASRVTHHTGVAIAGAAAVAAAVSGGIGGASVAQATTLGIRAAELGYQRGEWVAGAVVARRIAWAIGLVNPDDHDRSLRDIVELIGTSLATQESVPAAFAVLALHPDDPWQACLTAASLGGDSDTIAAMAGAIAGACHGIDGWPPDAVRTVSETNNLDLDLVAEKLLALRAGP